VAIHLFYKHAFQKEQYREAQILWFTMHTVIYVRFIKQCYARQLWVRILLMASGCESSAPFLVSYKARCQPTPYWR
jgi:hypothetical protein